MEAKTAGNREREVMDVWDPSACGDQADGSGAPDGWRLRQLALDPGGTQGRAQARARQVARLARGPDDPYRAAELLVLIEHEPGHHAREFGEARRLVELRRCSPRVWLGLRRAERGCARQPRP